MRKLVNCLISFRGGKQPITTICQHSQVVLPTGQPCDTTGNMEVHCIELAHRPALLELLVLAPAPRGEVSCSCGVTLLWVHR